MNNFVYCAPTRYEFGRGAEDRVGDMCRMFGATKVMIVFGQNHALKSGLIDRAEANLDKAGIAHCRLGGVQPNPIDTLVHQGIDKVKSESVDFLLAVGGGSVIDTTKAIAAGALYDGDFWDFFSGRPIDKAMPLGVILTVPGAGSEGSGNSVITCVERKQKISIRTDVALRPKFSLLNPELTFSLSPRQTAIGIADMMAHIMERYFSPTEGVEVTDRIAEGLLLAIITEAPRVLAHPDDYDARANIEWASTQAHNGVAGCGRTEDWASHGLEHVLSALYDVPHGAGLAVVFPAWMSFMATKRPAKVAQLGRRVFGVTETDDRAAAIEAVAHLRAFNSAVLRLPVTLKQLGIENPDIDLMTEMVHRDKGTPFGGYYALHPDDSRQIYTAMTVES